MAGDDKSIKEPRFGFGSKHPSSSGPDGFVKLHPKNVLRLPLALGVLSRSNLLGRDLEILRLKGTSLKKAWKDLETVQEIFIPFHRLRGRLEETRI